MSKYLGKPTGSNVQWVWDGAQWGLQPYATSSGGSSTGLITSSGSFSQPDLMHWIAAPNTLPSTGGLGFGGRFVVSGVMYIAGGVAAGGAIPQRTVMYASMSNPFVWTSASNALPVVSDSPACNVIGSKIYIWGSDQNIYTASVSNPLVWGTAPNTLPIVPGLYPTIVGNKIWMWSPYSAPGSIMTASVSNPLVWGIATSSMPALNISDRVPFVINGSIYMYGGQITSSLVPVQSIVRASVSDPGRVLDTSASLPVPVMYPTTQIIVGNMGYFLGFQSATPFATSNKILKFRLDDPLNVFSSSFANALPEAGRFGNSFVVIGNPSYALRIGGDIAGFGNNSNRIYYTDFQNTCTYIESSTSSFAPLLGKMQGSGAPVAQTPCERLGWPEWHTDYAKQF